MGFKWHIGHCRKDLDEKSSLLASNHDKTAGLNKMASILESLWQYPTCVNKLNIVDLVSVSNSLPAKGLSTGIDS
jgi:hypothetical protein